MFLHTAPTSADVFSIFHVPIEINICMAGNISDVITCAKFQDEFSGVTILQGVEFTIFLFIFAFLPYNTAALMRCL